MFGTNSLSRTHTVQTRFIQDRITNVEKYFGLLCAALGGYTRKTARVRDKGDDVARILQEYGESEVLNKTLQNALLEFADTLAAVQDYRNVQVERLESRVIGELTLYGGVCKVAREDLKGSFDARQKEFNQRRSLERTRDRNPHNRQQVCVAESKLLKATSEATRICENLEDQMDQFEERKVSDLKKTLTEFIQTELAFHAKSIELYTKAHQQMAAVQVEDDLEAFRNARDVYDAEFRNALRGDSSSSIGRLGSTGISSRSSLSPVITSKQQASKQAELKNITKSLEKLDIENYEEIDEHDSSSDE
ncbi:CBY1-interacting BAR domain-containing protein 1-B-like isoform X1 [Oratosquilla oratoria]|uniref:CBY1-interacting BAR domain-containing protein 1-B-like isoform X1 n=1 Tax=Oratosquilla oratoria TaxID=337810 RepID=UPI003F768BF9